MSSEQDTTPDDHSLSQAYRNASNESPSAGIDATILAAARDATTPESNVEPLPRKRTRTWTQPFSIAAIVMLCATLVVFIQRESGVYAPAATDSDIAATPVAKQSGQPAASEEALSGGENAADTIAKQSMSKTQEQPSLAAEPEPVLRMMPSVAPTEEKGEMLEAMLERREPLETPAANRAAAPMKPPTRESIATSESAMVSEVPPRTLRQRALADERERDAEALGSIALEDAMPADEPDDPAESMLRKIETLWMQGDIKLAEEQLALFRKRFPDYSEGVLGRRLPKDLVEAQ